MNIGLIGYGYWGKILESKLKEVANIKFVTTTKDILKIPLEEIDWIFVATPNETHLGIVEYCLRKKVNVFCEKPLTLSYEKSKFLFDLADEMGVKLYVDDVFNYRQEIKDLYKNLLYNPDTIGVTWLKESRTDYGSYIKSNFFNLAWHDLYILHSYLHHREIKDIRIHNTKECLHFSIKFGRVDVNFHYDRQSKTTSHIINGVNFNRTEQDALMIMIKALLRGGVDFNMNRDQTLFANKVIDMVIEKAYPTKVAVVGGGVFGCTIAARLAKEGINVDLFEKNSELFSQASSINQYRVHRGYHYPRSIETAEQSKDGSLSFIEKYPEAIMNKGTEHYYCIASEDSLVTSEQYKKFLDKVGLEYEEEDLPILSNIDLTVKAKETLFHPNILKDLCIRDLNKYNVNIYTNTMFLPGDDEGYDYVINATYSGLNMLFPKEEQIDYQFELCEKPVIQLPKIYRNKSIVIMDGPFMCIDPLGDSGYHVMGNVVHAIHHTNTGKFPFLPEKYVGLLNKGVVHNPSITNYNKFIKSASHFFKDIVKAKHIGSMFTFRTVLPKRDHDDARPTIVSKVDDKNIVVFSGKIPTCVEASERVLNLIIKP